MVDFKPMPKRFMVWDKKEQKWYEEDFAIRTDGAVEYKGVIDYGWQDRFVICQSTNLFDKDDKEIFEGSIVKDDHHIVDDRPLIAMTMWHSKLGVFTLSTDGTIDEEWGIVAENGRYELIGHVLSSPELLEER